MKILVPIKYVPDAQAKIQLAADQKSVDLSQTKFTVNPFDDIALEAALRLKEAGLAKEVLAVSIGSESVEAALRVALAKGADAAMLIKATAVLTPFRIACLLREVVMQEAVGLAILGKQAIDTDDNQVGQMLAGLLNWPQATFASKIILEKETLCVTREVDTGTETLILSLPAVITVDLRLNEPRFASLPGMMRAKKQAIKVVVAESLYAGVSQAAKMRIEVLTLPEKMRKKIQCEDVSSLVAALQQEGVL